MLHLLSCGEKKTRNRSRTFYSYELLHVNTDAVLTAHMLSYVLFQGMKKFMIGVCEWMKAGRMNGLRPRAERKQKPSDPKPEFWIAAEKFDKIVCCSFI